MPFLNDAEFKSTGGCCHFGHFDGVVVKIKFPKGLIAQ